MTTNAPKNCKSVKLSPKKIEANIIVEIGPTPATIAKLDELIIWIDADTKNEGITVAKTAINTPKTYTCQGKPKRSSVVIKL